MKSIQTPAKERETKACPTANNSDSVHDTADKFNGAASGEEETSQIPQQSMDKAHCFCPVLAKEHGEEAAVILQGIGYKIAKSKKVRDGRKWHYDTLNALEKRWPYLSDSGIHAILQRHTDNGNVFKDNFNKMHWMDRTVWYSMIDELLKRALDDKGKVWFDVRAAVQCHSIIAGTIYQNVRYHLLAFLANNPEFAGVPYYKVNKSALARVLNRSLSTIKREFKELTRHKLIAVNPKQPNEYTICNKTDLVVPDAMKNSASKSGSFMDKNGSFTEMRSGSSLEMTGSSMDKSRSFMDETGSEMDNNTHYKPFENHIHKHHSPYASRGVRGECSDAAGAAKESGHQHICYDTGSSTVPVEEKGVMAVGEEVIYQSISGIRIDKDKLKDSFSDSDLAVFSDVAFSVSNAFVADDIPFSVLHQAWSSSNEAGIISSIAPSLKSSTYKAAKEAAFNEEACEFVFLESLEFVSEAFRLHKAEPKTMLPLFKDCWHMVTHLYEELKTPYVRTDAPPQAKADLLIQDVRRCNKEGWPTYSNGQVDFTVSPSKAAGEAARAFFEANPHLSADDVWRVLADCVEVFKLKDKPEKGKYDPLFHARKGIDPKFLFKFWDEINAQLDAADKLAS